MTYFKDLTDYTYLHSNRLQTVNIGWLSKEHPFETVTPSDAFVHIISSLERTDRCRGYHKCEFCDDLPARGNGTVFVPSKSGRTYAAPDLITHYINVHHYAPPLTFVYAVMDYFVHLSSISEEI